MSLLESSAANVRHGRRANGYRPLTLHSLRHSRYWKLLPRYLQEGLEVVARVLPFRVNEYVLRDLIDWSRVPDDPIYQLTFLQRPMLAPADFTRVSDLLRGGAERGEIDDEVRRIRLRLNPHPAGQTTDNVPELGGRRLPGLQHKYRETVLFFPAAGQVCHAYCTYCFRWAQFVDLPEIRFRARDVDDLAAYLRAHPEVSDVLFTGGDPMVMRTDVLRRYVEPLLTDDLAHVQTIRIGTKATAYWPQRFVTDDDADDLMRLFEQVVASGRHLALMGHYSHPVELEPEIARQAASRIRSTGAEIRMQAPLIRRVNDDPAAWADLWQTGVRLGMVPYYMFVERDTGPRNYFEVPLARAHKIFREAYMRVSGLARTVRGPSMSAHPGKVRLLGTTEVAGQRLFVLDFLQARDPSWVRRPFFARYDPWANWLDELEPAFGEERFFFEAEGEDDEDARRSAGERAALSVAAPFRGERAPERRSARGGRG